MQESSSETTARRIGKYEVTGELGHGGMAVVYRARDTQLLRDVAIKVLHPHLANDDESRKRFLREAQAAARLRHPNIVEVFDFSVEADRESFMVSELLEGPTLRRFAEQHPGMPAEVTAAVGVVLCDALACAHGQGVVHRDVKPDNILLQKGGVLKLTDFGIAHVSDSGQMTVTGQVLGSPAHMAPEQIEGRSVDPRTDLFAVGTVLYALAVGRLPFEASHPHALLRKILETDYADPLRVAPGVGHRFAGIVRRCLERDVAKRWQDAGELRDALLAFVGEVGWDAVEAPLRRYLEEPEAFVDEHKRALLEKLPELGVRARREGRVTDALGYFNRALALEPGNARVLGLVRGIARRRQMKRAASALGIVAGAAVVGALGVVVVAKRMHRDERAESARPVVRPEHGASGPREVVAQTDASANPVRPVEVHPVEVAQLAVPSHPAESDPQPEAPTTSPTRPNVHHSVATGAPREGHPVGHPTDAVAPVMQAIQWRLRPWGAMVEIDGHSYSNGSLPPTLTVGPHLIHLVPSDGSCNVATWHITVTPDVEPVLVSRDTCTAPRPSGDDARASAP